jgi:hypothetical protein
VCGTNHDHEGNKKKYRLSEKNIGTMKKMATERNKASIKKQSKSKCGTKHYTMGKIQGPLTKHKFKRNKANMKEQIELNKK